jgi:hypothetical protein
MTRAQTYIIDAGDLFFFCLPGYANIYTFKKITMASFGIEQKPFQVVFDAEIENPTQYYQFEIPNYFKPHHQLILDFNRFII